MGTTRDKSNVLARLCRSATTDYFLFTSADMALDSAWVHTMLGAAAPGGGVVTSSTTAGGNLFGRLQNIGWLFSLLIRVLTDAGVPVTAVGNNMLVTRATYASIVGFAALAFSVTEDLQMFAQTVPRACAAGPARAGHFGAADHRAAPAAQALGGGSRASALADKGTV